MAENVSTPPRRPTLTAPARAAVRDVRAMTEKRPPQGPNRKTAVNRRTRCRHFRYPEPKPSPLHETGASPIGSGGLFDFELSQMRPRGPSPPSPPRGLGEKPQFRQEKAPHLRHRPGAPRPHEGRLRPPRDEHGRRARGLLEERYPPEKPVDSASSCPVFVAGELTASVVAAAVGLWGSRQRYPQIHSRAGGRSGLGGQRMIDDRSAFGIVVGEPVRPPEDRQPAIRVFVDARTLARTKCGRSGD